MLNILLTDLPIRAEFSAARWPIQQNAARLKGKSVRIVYDDSERLKDALRAVCAADASYIEVLDVDRMRFGYVHYDDSRHRRLKKQFGMEIMSPQIHWWPTRTFAEQVVSRLCGKPNEG